MSNVLVGPGEASRPVLYSSARRCCLSAAAAGARASAGNLTRQRRPCFVTDLSSSSATDCVGAGHGASRTLDVLAARHLASSREKLRHSCRRPIFECPTQYLYPENSIDVPRMHDIIPETAKKMLNDRLKKKKNSSLLLCLASVWASLYYASKDSLCVCILEREKNVVESFSFIPSIECFWRFSSGRNENIHSLDRKP